MYCSECENNKPLKGKRVIHKYKESGLENIILAGVTEFRCPKCGAVFFNFGNIDQLHALIANILLTKEGQLTGLEVRFLRTHIGYSSSYFAKALGYDRATISRIENSKAKVSKNFDKHVREAVYNREPNRDYDLHDMILNKPTKVRDDIRFASQKDRWVPRFPMDQMVLKASYAHAHSVRAQ